MSKYDSLVKYICILDGDSFGSWVIDRENDGTLEQPIQMPYVSYSDMVHHFIDDIYDFIDHNKDMELNRYGDILNQNGLKWGSKSMSTADVSNLDAQCIMALITGAVRAERFCDGALLGFFKDGSIRKWLERLKELDNGSGTEVR